MTNDNWENLDKRFVEDAVSGARAEIGDEGDLTKPTNILILFMSALDDITENRDALSFLVTPESLSAWGDFSEAATFRDSIEDRGIGSIPKRAYGDDDVAYGAILGGVTDSFQMQSEELVSAAAVVTMVWRPSFGRWMVHGFGDYIPADQVPHD